MSAAAEPTAKKMRIQSDEAVRYDRQMRLWGVDAQLNMMQSKVVVVGLGCLGAEVAKNLALGGVGTLTLVDAAPETSGDAAQNFLLSTDRGTAAADEQEKAKPALSRAEASLPALRAMNGLVQLGVCGSLAEALEGATCVVVTDVAKAEGLRMLRACRDASVPAVLCLSFGMLSMGVFDFGATFGNAVKDSTTGELATHEFCFPDAAKVFGGGSGDGSSDSRSWKNARKLLRSCVACVALWEAGCCVSDSVEVAAERIRAAAAAESAARGVEDLPAEYVERLAAHAVGHLSPVCCIAAGIYSQEVLKVVQRNGRPINNVFVYDALEESKGYSECIELA